MPSSLSCSIPFGVAGFVVIGFVPGMLDKALGIEALVGLSLGIEIELAGASSFHRGVEH
jgi:hypothetical protein